MNIKMLTPEEIKVKKKSGDNVKVAKFLRTTPDIVRSVLKKPNHFRHDSVIAAFTRLINERELLQSATK